ncbi:hypothetical protein EJB05_48114 [Eragrostis curvula]|uniref:Uncharacterized protein n=1 Tax=Eragrostis curvula TaxID=38414 RepID=A0A5J9T0S9_9POAL|nr:hypothetical protein EJB05_48114 [Eragrostis curvula]
MESGGHRSVPGAGAEGASGGLRCHACGYQYPHAHPSAKQRRTHRKHCGKSTASAAAAAAEEEGGAGEGEGRVLFPGTVYFVSPLRLRPSSGCSWLHPCSCGCVIGEGGGAGVVGGGGGDGIGASAAECGGGLPGSAQGAGGAAVDADIPAHSSHDGAGPQVIVDKCAEDHSNIASDIAPETNNGTDDGGTLNEVATQYSEEASLPEEGSPSVPELAVSSEQLQDVSIPVLPSEPGCVEGSSPELFASEMQNSNVVSLPSDATGGEISEQTNDSITEPDGTTVTGVDTIVKDAPNDDKSAKGGDFDSSCQENLQTNVGEGHSNTAVEEDSSDKNLSAVQAEEIPNDEPELDQQSRPMVTSSTQLVPTTEKSVKSGTQVPVGTDDFHSEATDTVKPQEQPDYASVTEDHLAVPGQTDMVEGQRHHIEASKLYQVQLDPLSIPEVTSSSDADNITKNVFSSDDIMGDSVQENWSLAHALLDMKSIWLVAQMTVKEKAQNGKSGADLTTHEMNEVDITELIEENQQNKENVADSIPHETNATEVYREIDVVCSPEAIEEKDSTSEINAENITDNAEDKKQSEEISTGNISDDTGMTYSTVNEEKMHNEAMTEDPSSHETIVAHIPDNVEEKYEETAVDHTADSTGVATILDSVEERKDQETTVDLTSYGIRATNNVEEEKKGEPTVGSVGAVEEKQIEETTIDPTPAENSTPQSTDDAEKGMQSEDTATVPAPEKSKVAQKTNDVEQKGEIAAKEISTVESMDDLKGAVQNEEIADKEVIVDSDRSHVSLKVLLADKNVETKEKKPSTKDRVLSFRRRSSKDSESPAKPGSPKAGSGQQDWNSPARLPAEKKTKGKKQQWVPFICCPSIH